MIRLDSARCFPRRLEAASVIAAFLLWGCATQNSDATDGAGGMQTTSAAGSGGNVNQAGQSAGAAPGSGGMGGTASAPSTTGGTTNTAGGTTSMTAGGTSSTAGGTTSTTGGTAGTVGGTAGVGGGSSSAGPGTTPDLIGPGGPTCGNANATHDDGWICLLSAPAVGTNVVGAWFDYAWPAATSCTHAFKKPSGAQRQVCFSGGNCASTAAGAGLGFSVCDVHGVDVSTWPEMQQLISSHGLSTTGKSPFSACNTGAKITQVSWTASGAGTPAGMSLVLQDAADATVGRIDNLAAGATSAMVPATLDTSKVASVHFQLGGSVKTWDFCLSKVTISYQ